MPLRARPFLVAALLLVPACGGSGRAADPNPTLPSRGGPLGHAVKAGAEQTYAKTSASPPVGAAGRELASRFPKQYAAFENGRDRASRAWALLIGINAYDHPTEDAVGSRQDAETLRNVLLSAGWRSDHIMLLTDHDATAARIVASMRWLASRTSARSKVVFHFAGHEMPRYDDPDHDHEPLDVVFWGSDNRSVLDSVVAKELRRVKASRMWIDLATCRAGGFDDAGMFGKGRIITYSSKVGELSYEDIDEQHSVLGVYMLSYGMTQSHADADHDGHVTVEESYRWARPYVLEATHGKQHPKMVDHAPGAFRLEV